MVYLKILRISNVRVTSFVIFAFFTLLVIGDMFSISFLSYLDEIIEILSLGWLCYSLINKRNLSTIVLLISIFFVGIIGNMISGYDITLKNILLDYFLILKFPIIFIAIFDFINHTDIRKNEIIQLMSHASILLSIVLFVGVMFNYVTRGGRVGFYNMGYPAAAGFYAFAFSLLLFYNKEINKLLKITIISLNFIVAVFLSQSSASTIYFIALFMSYLYVKYIKRKVKGNFLIYMGLVVGLVLVLVLFQDKINGYFHDITAPRYLFFKNGFFLANQYKGFGVGFGLFGGNVAANNYSPVYIDLGFNEIWTVKEGSNFLIDSFFPTIIGELGYIGSVLYLLLILNCVKEIKKFKSLVFILIVIILGGFTANFINSTIGVCLTFCIVVCYFWESNKACNKIKDRNVKYKVS